MATPFQFDAANVSHNCLINFQFIYGNLKKAERKAADYCLQHPEEIATYTISEIAERVHCSEATLVRLAKRLGYSGYPELRSKILPGEEAEAQVPVLNLSVADSPEHITSTIYKTCMLYIQDSLNSVDFHQFEEAIQRISTAKRLLFVGSGDAHFVASSSAQKFLRLGYNVNVASDFDTQLIHLACMSSSDVVICISHGGRTKLVCELAKAAQQNGIYVVSVTNFPRSPLVKLSNNVLLTASFAYDAIDEILIKRVPTMCLLDALYMCIRLNGQNEEKNIEHINLLLANNKI